MAPQYKLIYFNVKSIGEPSRLLLAHANIEYEDVRIEKSNWATMKPTTPWGKLPILEEGDFKLSQSHAILKYLGARHGYAGESDQERGRMDEIMGATLDIKDQRVANMKEADPVKKAEQEKKMNEEIYPLYLNRLCSLLEKNGTGYLVGRRISYVDFFIFAHIGSCQHVGSLDDFPALKKHNVLIANLPGVKEWLVKRPNTDH